MLRKSHSNCKISFDPTRDRAHDGFGSKGFTEQLNRVKSSEPGTMIRKPIHQKWDADGERKGIGRFTTVSFSAALRIERCDLQREIKIPQGERRSSSRGERRNEVGQRAYRADPAQSGAYRIEWRSGKPNGFDESSSVASKMQARNGDLVAVAWQRANVVSE